MHPRYLVAGLSVLFLIAGCSTRSTTYVVRPGGPALSRQDAQQELVRNSLSSQIRREIDKPLEVVAAPLPDYPSTFRKSNIEGTVRVKFLIEHDGSVSNTTVVGSPHPGLAAVTLMSVMQWKFKPLTQNGQPTKEWVTFESVFRLED